MSIKDNILSGNVAAARNLQNTNNPYSKMIDKGLQCIGNH